MLRHKNTKRTQLRESHTMRGVCASACCVLCIVCIVCVCVCVACEFMGSLVCVYVCMYVCMYVCVS